MNPTVMELLLGVGAIVIAAAIIGGFKTITSMYAALRTGQETMSTKLADGLGGIALTSVKMEGRLNSIDQWCQAHERSDQEHFDTIKDSFKEIRGNNGREG